MSSAHLKVVYPFLIAPGKPKMDLIGATKFASFFTTCLHALSAEPLGNEARCDSMEHMIKKILDEPSLWDKSILSELALNIANHVHQDFVTRIFPAHKDDDGFARSIASPLFVLFRHLCIKFEESSKLRAPLIALTYELSEVFQGVGFLLLYFIKVSQVTGGRLTVYNYFQKSRWPQCLVDDLRRAWLYDPNILFHVVPDVYMRFSNTAVANIDLFHLVVSSLDPAQLLIFISLILQGNLVTFREDTVLPVLEASLDWEYWEQNCTWRLLAAHKFKPEDTALKLIPKIDYYGHPEAASNLLLILYQMEPSPTIAKLLVQRNIKNANDDMFLSCIFKSWELKLHISDMAGLCRTMVEYREDKTNGSDDTIKDTKIKDAHESPGLPTPEEIKHQQAKQRHIPAKVNKARAWPSGDGSAPAAKLPRPIKKS